MNDRCKIAPCNNYKSLKTILYKSKEHYILGFVRLMLKQQALHFLTKHLKCPCVFPKCTEMHPIQNTIVPGWKNRNEDAMIAAVHCYRMSETANDKPARILFDQSEIST